MISKRHFPQRVYHYNKMCKTQLNMTKISLNFKRLITTAKYVSLSFSVSVCSEQIGNNRKHNSHSKGTVNSIRILF